MPAASQGSALSGAGTGSRADPGSPQKSVTDASTGSPGNPLKSKKYAYHAPKPFEAAAQAGDYVTKEARQA